MTNDKLTVRYRTIDIVTPVMIAVAFGVIFLGYGAVYSLLKPATSVYLPIEGIPVSYTHLRAHET